MINLNQIQDRMKLGRNLVIRKETFFIDVGLLIVVE